MSNRPDNADDLILAEAKSENPTIVRWLVIGLAALGGAVNQRGARGVGVAAYLADQSAAQRDQAAHRRCAPHAQYSTRDNRVCQQERDRTSDPNLGSDCWSAGVFRGASWNP